MEYALKYAEQLDAFCTAVAASFRQVEPVRVLSGRKFDRIQIGRTVTYFVHKTSWDIFGAKSSFQYNPRRTFGSLDTADQYDWSIGQPVPSSREYTLQLERENEIKAGYRQRGRPRKAVAAVSVGA